MDDDTAEALIGAVRDVAKAEILPRFRNLSSSEIDTKSGPEDLVTIADRAAEDALSGRIAAILPGAAIVGEEAVEEDASILDALAGGGTCAIVDPIDGTWNFARGLATFGVILAVTEAGRTTFGLLYDPVLDDWMMARAGQGAVYGRPGGDRRPLAVAPPRPPEREIGYVPLGLFDLPRREALAATYPRFGRVQSLRCSCHEYRMMAAGHADWQLSQQSKPWDHLAGRLVVSEAGGAIGSLGGEPYDPTDPARMLVAASSETRLAELTDLYAPILTGPRR